MTIHFESEVADFKSDSLVTVKDWLGLVAKSENKKLGEIVYKFVSDETILEVNQSFLNHSYITDIITFDTSYLKVVSGEIYICIDEVKRNAERHNSPNFTYELHRVILHGLLHLIGFKDGSDEEKKTMRFKENFYLKLLNIS